MLLDLSRGLAAAAWPEVGCTLNHLGAACLCCSVQLLSVSTRARVCRRSVHTDQDFGSLSPRSLCSLLSTPRSAAISLPGPQKRQGMLGTEGLKLLEQTGLPPVTSKTPPC